VAGRIPQPLFSGEEAIRVTRVRGFVALSGLLGLGAMAAGLVEQVPASLRAIAALALLLVLPAWLLAPHRPFRGESGRPALQLSLAFLSWLCILSVWTTGFIVAGAPFHAYAAASVWMLLLVFGAAAAWSLRGNAHGTMERIPRAWWILAAACALFAAAIPFRMSVGEDGLDHVGYVRRILTDDTLRPAGVLALPPEGDVRPATDPRKGALHGVFALVCWISGADPVVVWRWIPALMFPVAALAAIAFNGAFLATRAARATAAALVLLSFDGNPFRFAGASAHGETMAAMWCWVLTAAAMSASRPGWPLWTLLAAGGVMIHLGVAAHVLVLVATIACLGGAWGISPRDRMRMCLPMCAGTALALAARHADLAGDMNIIHAHTQGVMFVDARWFVASPLEILRIHGMLFLGGLACVPALVFAARTRPQARAILAASAIPFAVSFVPWLATLLYENGSYMVFRSLLHVPAFAAIVFCAVSLAGAVRRGDRRAWLLGVPAAAVWLLVFLRPVPSALAHDVRVRAREDRVDTSESASLIRAVAELPAGSVVLADPATSYLLSAHTSHRFVAVHQQHGNPRDPFALERIRAVRDVLSPYVMPEVAVAACRRFGVGFVVVNGSPPRDDSQFLSVWQPRSYPVALRRMDAMQGSFARVDSAGAGVIYRFDSAARATPAWPAQDQPVRVGAPLLERCEAAAPQEAFRVTGISVSPARVLPGDTIRVTLGYARDAPASFQLPVLVHVRFDHEALSREREYPGEKQWRRLRDGWDGKRSRFREDVRPGHGVYDPDLWPVGFDLYESFNAVLPWSARLGRYRVEVSIDPLTQVPNFHLRDLLFNRDHYSGVRCATLDVADHVVGTGEAP
jgi:hypothetical protein